MRCLAVLLLCAAAGTAGDVPTPAEEVAALLLSPLDGVRAEGKQALAAIRDDDAFRARVFEHFLAHAGNRVAWAADLERASKRAGGANLKRLMRMIRALRGSQDVTVGTTLYLVSMPVELAARILGPDERVVLTSSKPAWERWWDWIGADPEAQSVFWRATPGLDGTRVGVEHRRQISFVKGYHLVEGVVDPDVGTIDTGVIARWTPILSRDREFVTLHFELDLTTVERPIPVGEVVVGERKMKVQTPKITKATVKNVLTMPAGGFAVWSVPVDGAAAGHKVLALVTARVGAPDHTPPPERAPAPPANQPGDRLVQPK